jgi:hypothetical protein
VVHPVACVENISRTFLVWFMFFRFPPDARWSPERSVVEFGIGLGEYEGVVRVSRRVFQTLLPEAPTPERCVEAYHLHRTRLELIAERKVRRKQLTDDGNVEITGCDLREREIRARQPPPHRVSPGHFMRAQQAVRDAERRFPVRVRLAVPPEGLGSRLDQIIALLDANCGADGRTCRRCRHRRKDGCIATSWSHAP